MRLISTVYRYMMRPAAEYQLATQLFLKALAIIYGIAFWSLFVQIEGLVGSNGILPLTPWLEFLYQNNGAIAWLYKPAVFWFDSSDFTLALVCLLGCLFSVLLFFGFKSMWSLIILFILYLSLYHAGQVFLTFQWDSLLLETGFLAIFLCAGPKRLILFLFHWLLFRLRFMSGISKLASEDPTWSNLTALNYYFETQPLPHVGAWYFHQLPDWILQSGVVLVLFTELIVPFFIFLPRKFRLLAAAATILLQLIIIATSNHNWINLLTIVLCLLLLDDGILRKIIPLRLAPYVFSDNVSSNDVIAKRNYVLPFFAVLIMVSSLTAFSVMVTHRDTGGWLDKTSGLVRSWGIGHIYHVFPTMQTERHELIIEGSNDGKDWQSYVFRYKPGALDKKPVFNLPHQPRLDWMIWFVPPRDEEMMYWFGQFLHGLHEGSQDILDLLESNPFADKPPEYLRVLVYRYRFTTIAEREISGSWWSREYLGLFPYVRPRNP